MFLLVFQFISFENIQKIIFSIKINEKKISKNLQVSKNLNSEKKFFIFRKYLEKIVTIIVRFLRGNLIIQEQIRIRNNNAIYHLLFPIIVIIMEDDGN